jgi:hypothetical protein
MTEKKDPTTSPDLTRIYSITWWEPTTPRLKMTKSRTVANRLYYSLSTVHGDVRMYTYDILTGKTNLSRIKFKIPNEPKPLGI